MLDAATWRLVRIIYPILASVAVVGICLNTVLLLTTLTTKSLRSTANILIGCCALFDIIHQTGYLIQFPILFYDYYINSFWCTSMIFIPELGLAAGACCVLSLGIDRMISIVALKHLKNFLKYYFIFIALFCSWCGYLMIGFYIPQKLICAMPAPYHGDAFGHWALSLSAINALSVIVYFVMWQTAKKREISKHSKKIMLSIAIVTAFEVTCWLIYSFLINLSKLIAEPDRRNPYHKVACLFVNFGIAIKCIVYYGISTEYRRAIRDFLGMKATSSVNSSTGPVAPTQTPMPSSVPPPVPSDAKQYAEI